MPFLSQLGCGKVGDRGGGGVEVVAIE